jgi:hypothetical protein
MADNFDNILPVEMPNVNRINITNFLITRNDQCSHPLFPRLGGENWTGEASH